MLLFILITINTSVFFVFGPKLFCSCCVRTAQPARLLWPWPKQPIDAGSEVNVDDNLSLLTSVCWQATTTTTTAFIIFSLAHCQFLIQIERNQSIRLLPSQSANRCIFFLYNLSSLSTSCLSLSRRRQRSFNVKIHNKYFVII